MRKNELPQSLVDAIRKLDEAIAEAKEDETQTLIRQDDTRVDIEFIKANGRRPVEGDFYADPIEYITGSRDGRVLRTRTCYDYIDGRWEGFVSFHDNPFAA